MLNAWQVNNFKICECEYMLARSMPSGELAHSLAFPHRAGELVSWNGTTVLGHMSRNGTQGISFQLRARAQRGGRPLFGEGDMYIPPTLKSTPPCTTAHRLVSPLRHPRDTCDTLPLGMVPHAIPSNSTASKPCGGVTPYSDINIARGVYK